MRVNPVAHPINQPPRAIHRPAAGERAAPPEQSRSSGAKTPAIEEQGRQEKTKGVVRLLEQGHFKGVADVRLRINFFDELSNRAAARTAAMLPDAVGSLVTSMEDKVNEAIESLDIPPESQEAIAEALAAFEEQVSAAVEPQRESGDIALDTLSNDLRAAFDTLMQRLGEILQSPAGQPEDEPAIVVPEGETGVSGDDSGEAVGIDDANDAGTDSQPQALADAVLEGLEGPDEGPDTPTTDIPGVDSGSESPDEPASPNVDELLSGLQAAFDEALTTLVQNLQDSLQPGEPSPPADHGAAYDKFLAIYHDLLDANTPGEPDTPVEPQVDETI